MQKPSQECPRGDHNGPSGNRHAHISLDANHRSGLVNNARYSSLFNVEVLRLLQNGFHPKLVRLFVALNSGGTYRWALSLVQHSKLNSGCISVKPHRSSHGVDFANNMSFCQSADGRVTRHLPDSIQVLGQHQCAAADSGGRQCRFDSGMSAPYYDYVIIGR